MNYKIENEGRSFFNHLGFQLIGEYESAEVTAQGSNDPQYSVDFGLRKEFLKDKKASFSFNINDILNTNKYGNIYDTEYFYQESSRRRNVRSFRVKFTWKFGKENFNLLKKHNNNDRGNNDDE